MHALSGNFWLQQNQIYILKLRLLSASGKKENCQKYIHHEPQRIRREAYMTDLAISKLSAAFVYKPKDCYSNRSYLTCNIYISIFKVVKFKVLWVCLFLEKTQGFWQNFDGWKYFWSRWQQPLKQSKACVITETLFFLARRKFTMIHPVCVSRYFHFQIEVLLWYFFVKCTIFSLRGCSKKSGFSKMFCFSRILSFENLGEYLIKFLNILEGIHVLLFPFLVASGYIPDAPSSEKLPHTYSRE